MWFKLAFACVLLIAVKAQNGSKVVCYYDSRAFSKEGLGKVSITDIEPGLSQCTHLVYGYVGINDQKRVTSLNAQRDLDSGSSLFRHATQLKRKFPGIKVLLGVGGDAQDNYDKWLELLEQSTSRISFINSAYDLIKTYDFDGMDLAYNFPKTKPKKIRSGVGSFFYGFQKAIGVAGNPVDAKSDEHKEEFTALIRELKNSFRHDGYLLSITVNPNVNSTLYLDVPSTATNFDWINVAAFDYQTPARNKKEVDYPSPLYKPTDRNPDLNADGQVSILLKQGIPASKIVLGIPTFGRAWNLEDGATATGVPPFEGANGPAPEGIQSKQEGLYSYPEICAKLTNDQNKNLKGENAPVRKVGDPTKRFGPYGYRLPDSGKYGVWLGYEDPDSAGNKAAYVRAKNLGGIAIMDLTLDDFRGSCGGDKFPILKAARTRLV